METFLGRLGNREGVNVAKVEVTWGYDRLPMPDDQIDIGYYIVHATGDEPECEGEDGTVYAVFENLVHAAMDAKVEAGSFDFWEINDISSI